MQAHSMWLLTKTKPNMSQLCGVQTLPKSITWYNSILLKLYNKFEQDIIY